MEERKVYDNTKPKSKDNYTGKLVSDYTPEERKAMQIKGQQNSVKTRRKRRAAKDVLLDILNSTSTNTALAETLKAKGIEGTELATLLMAMTNKASKSAQMAELVFRLSGDLTESPSANITIVNQLSDEQLLQERQRLMSGGQVIDVTPRPPELEE